MGPTFSLRKYCSAGGTQCERHLLQWGRNFFVTEIARARWTAFPVQALQWGRNFFVTEIWEYVWSKKTDAYFNGAVTFSLRKYGWRFAGSTPTCSNFNGAVTFSLRKFPSCVVMKRKSPKLQWGRNFFVTEIRSFSKTFGWIVLNFNGAVTFSLRKFSKSVLQGSERGHFNGAVTFSLRK